jgi:hypothetical protein
MPITVEQLPNEPIVLVRVTDPFDVNLDIPYLIQEASRLFDASQEPLFDITEVVDLKGSFSDLVTSLSMLTKGRSSVWKHPNVMGYAIVMDSTLTRVAASALGKDSATPVTVTKTLDEALVVAREAIEKRRVARS